MDRSLLARRVGSEGRGSTIPSIVRLLSLLTVDVLPADSYGKAVRCQIAAECELDRIRDTGDPCWISMRAI